MRTWRDHLTEIAKNLERNAYSQFNMMDPSSCIGARLRLRLGVKGSLSDMVNRLTGDPAVRFDLLTLFWINPNAPADPEWSFRDQRIAAKRIHQFLEKHPNV